MAPLFTFSENLPYKSVVNSIGSTFFQDTCSDDRLSILVDNDTAGLFVPASVLSLRMNFPE